MLRIILLLQLSFLLFSFSFVHDVKYFFGNNTPDSIIKKHENYSSITYDLGNLGANITLNFGESYGVDEQDRKWLLGDSIEFIWKDDHFIRRKPTFNE